MEYLAHWKLTQVSTTEDNEIVWLTEERTFAELLWHGAFISRVRWYRGNARYEDFIENDEINFDAWEEANEYERE